MISSDSSSGRGAGKILLAGDISRAFFDAATVCGEGCEVQVEMRDAISSAVENSFAVIGVVISGSSFRLGSALKAFREANPDARIILLAQMYEEPLAIELLGGFWPGEPLCTVDFEHFARFADLWLETGPGLAADLYEDDIVDELDLKLFVYEWLYYCPLDWPLK
jgi:riboflavin biosynthesis pyrimidine reductase